MKLSTWIEKKGGTAPVAKMLQVGRNRVYAWRVGKAFPRPDLLKLIREKSNYKVEYADMVDEHLQKKAFFAAKSSRSKNKKQHVISKVKTLTAKGARVKLVRKKKKIKEDPGF